MAQINQVINNIVWGPVMLSLLIGTGLILSIRLHFFQFRKFGFIIKNTIGSLFSDKQHKKGNAGVTPFQAVATAMAGTIGTGSIAGVATAIVSGGAGAIFWMWVSALLGMITKYSEILLSLNYREKNTQGQWSGGPMYYIEKGLKCKWLAVMFAFFVVIASFGIGNATQGNSISVALESTIGVNPLITAIVLLILVGAVILGGIKRIASVNEKLVPFMSLVYIVTAFIALILNLKNIPAAFSRIFREAFTFRAIAGGVGGYGIFSAMRYGFARGVFSNEAGLGSAPIAHAASSTEEPVEQAFWGVFEVFFTTIIICTCTALVILSTGTISTGLSGSSLGIAAYNKAVPGIGGIAVTVATTLFATSSMLGWAYYGEKAMEYLFRGRISDVGIVKAIKIYRTVYTLVVFVGAFGGAGSLELIWQISDTMNGLMALPNLIGIFGLMKIVEKKTKDYFDRMDPETEGGKKAGRKTDGGKLRKVTVFQFTMH
ncbi:MAG: sodium:alanine symporter family protein [Lachnospiraceae bacterium]|nr:sodium:alanine symporter family protein [Lachnospiraceae bacterium]